MGILMNQQMWECLKQIKGITHVLNLCSTTHQEQWHSYKATNMYDHSTQLIDQVRRILGLEVHGHWRSCRELQLGWKNLLNGQLIKCANTNLTFMEEHQ